jgi:hypothetical protein
MQTSVANPGLCANGTALLAKEEPTPTSQPHQSR